jgi:DNA-binding IclR family transcriptional regulator
MTKSVPAAERTMTMLELVAASRKGSTLAEVSRHLKLPRSSTYYLLQTLARQGYLWRNSEGGRYLLTPKLFDLANRSLAALGLREKARPLLRGLMQQTGLTVHLAVLAQGEMVLIDKIEPPGPEQLATWVGKRIPVHCTGVGKAMLAYLPPERLGQTVSRGLIRYNDNTITSVRRLKAELEKVRQVGYAVDDEEETLGYRCVGAAVLDEANSPVAAISLAGTTEEVTAANLHSLAAQVAATAATLARQIAERAAAGMTTTA